MVRSLIIIFLSIVCGTAAAVGMNQVFRRNTSTMETVKIPTRIVIVASERISRGTSLTKEMVSEVDWPEDLLPAEVMTSVDDVVGRVAMSTILPREPLFMGKLTEEHGEGFIASIIKPGMRAYSIETKGPSASVAGFVRPGDRVDVLVNVSGNANDDTGGGFTTTLLQSVEIVAIDRMLDPDADPLKMVEMWTKGNNFTSVTLLVTPDQAALLSLGQDYGDLSLSLRRMGDTEQANISPMTMKGIRLLETGQVVPDSEVSPTIDKRPDREAPALTLIHTIRGSQRAVVPLHFQSAP